MGINDTVNTNQHYVPQMLLRGFTIEKDGEQIYVFDKSEDRIFISAVRNIASERGYYDLNGSAEIDASMNQIDDIASPIIQQIRQCKSLTSICVSERIALAAFTIMQMLRTRGFQEHMRHLAETMIEAIKRKTGELPQSWPNAVDRAQTRAEYLKMIPRLGQDFLPYLLDKDLLLYRTDPEHLFLISDHPVALNNTVNRGDGIMGTLGLAVPGIEIYLPISGDLTLAFICPSIGQSYEDLSAHLQRLGGFVSEMAFYYLQARDTGKAMKLKPENVRFQNSLQILNAERFLISAIDNFHDAKGIINEYPGAKHGRRMKVM